MYSSYLAMIERNLEKNGGVEASEDRVGKTGFVIISVISSWRVTQKKTNIIWFYSSIYLQIWVAVAAVVSEFEGLKSTLALKDFSIWRIPAVVWFVGEIDRFALVLRVATNCVPFGLYKGRIMLNIRVFLYLLDFQTLLRKKRLAPNLNTLEKFFKICHILLV